MFKSTKFRACTWGFGSTNTNWNWPLKITKLQELNLKWYHLSLGPTKWPKNMFECIPLKSKASATVRKTCFISAPTNRIFNVDCNKKGKFKIPKKRGKKKNWYFIKNHKNSLKRVLDICSICKWSKFHKTCNWGSDEFVLHLPDILIGFPHFENISPNPKHAPIGQNNVAIVFHATSWFWLYIYNW